MDVHTRYAPDYIAQCLQALARSGATNVGGAWRAEGEAAVAARDRGGLRVALRLPAGPPRATSATKARSTPSTWAAGGATTFGRLGGFDETLVRNQDDELALRIVRSGGRVWQSAAIRSWLRAARLVPRAVPPVLAVRLLEAGRDPQTPAAGGAAPPGAVCLRRWRWRLAAFGALAGLWQPLALLAGGYLLALAAAAIARPWREDRWPVGRHPPVMGGMHIGYGLGFRVGACDAWRHGRGARPVRPR